MKINYKENGPFTGPTGMIVNTQLLGLNKLKSEIADLRQQLIDHPVYNLIGTLEHIQIFMRYHIFAVWDFMSLVKSLQKTLTCVEMPWVPVSDANIRYFINEIVLGEESDVDEHHNRISHFELYLQAMEQADCDISEIIGFIDEVKLAQEPIEKIIIGANIPEAAKAFMLNTFATIKTNEAHIIAPVFAFSREELIPGMFREIINSVKSSFPNKLDIFQYYIERHIEVDGDHHSKLASEMTVLCCKNNSNYWQNAVKSTKSALESRLALWDAIYHEVKTCK